MEHYSMFPPGFMRPEMQSDMATDMRDTRMNNNSEVLAMAYIPRQKFREIYEKDKGLMRGTIFCELDKPFRGSGR